MRRAQKRKVFVRVINRGRGKRERTMERKSMREILTS